MIYLLWICKLWGMTKSWIPCAFILQGSICKLWPWSQLNPLILIFHRKNGIFFWTSVEISKSCSTTKDLGNFEPRFLAPLQPKCNWKVHRKSWGFKFNKPCKALHRTGWAGRLLAWPPFSWKRACTACCNSYYAGSWGHNWSELAPGTPMAPDNTTAKKNKRVRMHFRLFHPFCIWDLTSPSENNLCFQPQSLPSLHQTRQSSPPGQHGSTSSWQCSPPRSAQPCCLHPVRFWIWNVVNWMFAVWPQKCSSCLQKASHLVIADGDSWVQKVSNLPEVLKALRFQRYPFTVGFPDSLIHQQPNLLNLGYRQGLACKHKRWQRI